MSTYNEIDDTLFAHSLKNWGAKQNPPAYVRMRLLRQVRITAASDKAHRIGKSLLMSIRALNPYWTGRPLNHTELASGLFSRAMVDCLSMGRYAMRMVC